MAQLNASHAAHHLHEELGPVVERVRRYQAQRAELRAAHHFVFAAPSDEQRAHERFEIVVIGQNPAEEDDVCRAVGPYEETLLMNFRAGRPPNRSTVRWRRRIAELTSGRNTIETEFFFWSSKGLGRHFVERYGTPLKGQAEHLDFCRSCNRELIDQVEPVAVLVPGLANASFFAAFYALDWQSSRHDEGDSGHRLVEKFVDSKGRPWLFTKHLTGSYGFSRNQMDKIRDYLNTSIVTP